MPLAIDGYDGEPGEQGLPGATGPAGATGATGGVGPAGPTGPRGPMGIDGYDGLDGDQGLPGLTGPQGPTGSTGGTGGTGPAGAAGLMGPPGFDGYDGDEGGMGMPGPVGPTGATGATGAPGSGGTGGGAAMPLALDPEDPTYDSPYPLAVQHPLLSAQHSDTTREPPARGAMIIGGAGGVPSGTWGALPIGGNDQFAKSDGSDVSWATLSDSHMTNLTAFLRLAGQAGGQTASGGTAAADLLTLKPTTAAASTGRIVFDNTGGAPGTTQSAALLFQFPDARTTPGTAIGLGTFQTLELGVSGGLRAVVFPPTINWPAGSPNGVPLLLFSASFSVQMPESTAAKINTPQIFQHAPTWTPATGAITITNAGASGYLAFADKPTFADAAGGAVLRFGTTEANGWYATVNQKFARLGTGWLIRRLMGLHVEAIAAGTGTVDTHVAVEIEDLNTFGGTKTNPYLSIRSIGTAIQMRHAGPALFGVVGAPNTASGVDVAGDLSTRVFALALANGVNDDIAITNHSFIRITGPTAAFNITSVGTPLDGKIVTLINTTAFAMTITNAAGTGTAPNRIVTSTNANLVGTAGNQTTVTLIYDSTTGRWRDISFRA